MTFPALTAQDCRRCAFSMIQSVIEPFPEDHELVSFFETLPTYPERSTSDDYEVPTAYLKQVYSSSAGSSAVTFAVERASGLVDLDVTSADGMSVRVVLHWVAAISIEEHRRLGKTLVVKPSQPELRDLRLRLGPEPSIIWGTEMYPDRPADPIV